MRPTKSALKSVLTLGLFFAALKPAEGLARGGSLVGNGAGIVEQNVIYAYQSLTGAIEDCTRYPHCRLSQKEAYWLEKVREMVASVPAGERKIEFVSASEKPGFFDTGETEYHRIAKTDLSPGAVIYFNRDLLYDREGQPALDLPALSAILVHELGHQAGHEDHTFLDQLGAKIRYLLSQETIQFRMDQGPVPVTMTVVNFMSLGSPVGLYVTLPDRMLSLGGQLFAKASCMRPESRVVGWKVVNGHWSLPIENESGTELPFLAWVKLQCLGADSTLAEELQNLQARLSFSVKGELGAASLEQAVVEVTPVR